METSGEPDVIADFAAIWKAADKVVYSSTLDAVASERTAIERTFDAEDVRRRKRAADRDLSIGGPTLGAEAFRAGLVDECELFLVPAVVGGGTRAFADGLRLTLELLDERRFGNGTVHLRYGVR
jgi:dihydrofolate reductase